jgi:formate/nitrite transporter
LFLFFFFFLSFSFLSRVGIRYNFEKEPPVTMTTSPSTNDALGPAQVAAKYLVAAQTQIQRTEKHPVKTFVSALMAGLFIALGAFGSLVVTYQATDGPTKALGGIIFSVGILCILLIGGELFTGNIMLAIAMFSRKVKLSQILLNWLIAYLGNFSGAVLTALLMFGSEQYDQNGTGVQSLRSAQRKNNLAFSHIVILGIFTNIIVFSIVWMAIGARSTEGKILATIIPVIVFYLCPFEHSAGNGFTISYAIFVKQWAPDIFFRQLAIPRSSFDAVVWSRFFRNQAACVIGHIVGGVFMSAVYWFVYLTGSTEAAIEIPLRVHNRVPQKLSLYQREKATPNSPTTPYDVEIGEFKFRNGQPVDMLTSMAF